MELDDRLPVIFLLVLIIIFHFCSLKFLIGNAFNQLPLYLEYFRDIFISVLFAPLIHARALTVEPLKFSSRQVGVAYELSYIPTYFHDLSLRIGEYDIIAPIGFSERRGVGFNSKCLRLKEVARSRYVRQKLGTD